MATSSNFPRENHLWFLSLGSEESNALNGSVFGVEMREILPIKTILRKEHALMGLNMGLIPFSYLGFSSRAHFGGN